MAVSQARAGAEVRGEVLDLPRRAAWRAADLVPSSTSVGDELGEARLGRRVGVHAVQERQVHRDQRDRVVLHDQHARAVLELALAPAPAPRSSAAPAAAAASRARKARRASAAARRRRPAPAWRRQRSGGGVPRPAGGGVRRLAIPRCAGPLLAAALPASPPAHGGLSGAAASAGPRRRLAVRLLVRARARHESCERRAVHRCASLRWPRSSARARCRAPAACRRAGTCWRRPAPPAASPRGSARCRSAGSRGRRGRSGRC